MTDDHRHGNRRLRPSVPFVNVQVGAADAGAVHLDHHVIDADFGLGDVHEPQTLFRFIFDKCFHNKFWYLGITSTIMETRLQYARIISAILNIWRFSARLPPLPSIGEREKIARSNTLLNIMTPKRQISKSSSPESVNRDLGGRVRHLRTARGWSLESLASASGVSRSMLSQIEREQANPTLAVTLRIARAFGLSLGECWRCRA